MNKGFTLLELLISIALTAITIVIIMSAFHLGIKVWEKGEENMERYQAYRVILNLIEKQLSALSINKVTNKWKEPIFLEGTESSLDFLSSISIIPGNEKGLARVKYLVRSSDDGHFTLNLFESLDLLQEADLSSVEAESFTTSHVLIDDTCRMTFKYLANIDESGNFVWQDEWNYDNNQAFPKAVKLLIVDEDETVVVEDIVRVPSEFEKE